jgi:tetratricopeptide (TPR) repeat protein
LAHEAYARVSSINPESNHASNAIAKVELRDGKFDDAVNSAMRAFFADPNSATARLIGNIYREVGMNEQAYRWYGDAEYIDGPQDEKVTQAHIQGLLELARESLPQVSGGMTGGDS